VAKDLFDFVQRGKVLIVRRQFQEAAKVCRLGLLGQPQLLEGRLVLGMALMALGRYEEVLGEMRVALDIDDRSALAWLLKGEALSLKGDYAQAEKVLVRAKELDPSNEKADKLLADVRTALAAGFRGGHDDPVETREYPANRDVDEDATARGPKADESMLGDPDTSPTPLTSDDFVESTIVEGGAVEEPPTEPVKMPPMRPQDRVGIGPWKPAGRDESSYEEPAIDDYAESPRPKLTGAPPMMPTPPRANSPSAKLVSRAGRPSQPQPYHESSPLLRPALVEDDEGIEEGESGIELLDAADVEIVEEGTVRARPGKASELPSLATASDRVPTSAELPVARRPPSVPQPPAPTSAPKARAAPAKEPRAVASKDRAAPSPRPPKEPPRSTGREQVIASKEPPRSTGREQVIASKEPPRSTAREQVIVASKEPPRAPVAPPRDSPSPPPRPPTQQVRASREPSLDRFDRKAPPRAGDFEQRPPTPQAPRSTGRAQPPRHARPTSEITPLPPAPTPSRPVAAQVAIDPASGPTTPMQRRTRDAGTVITSRSRALRPPQLMLLVVGAVAAVAVVAGLTGWVLREYRVSARIERHREAARQRMAAGTFAGYQAAAEEYRRILVDRPTDDATRAARARIMALMAFEFGEPVDSAARASFAPLIVAPTTECQERPATHQRYADPPCLSKP